MSRRYDSRTTTFSPEGRLYQVEYAMEAIQQAGSAVGILAKDGVVLAAEKRISSKLIDVRSPTEKMYKIDDHVACAVAGITGDANILVNYAQLTAQRYTYLYQEPIPMDQLITTVCDLKHSYTQYGGLRPFGVSFLFAGWDEHYGFQLFKSDPSGNFGGCYAGAIGANFQAAQSILKSDYKMEEEKKDEKKEEEKKEQSLEHNEHKKIITMNLDEALLLAVKVLSKTMDTTEPTPEKVEFSTITRVNGEVEYHILSKDELEALLKKAAETKEKTNAGDI